MTFYFGILGEIDCRVSTVAFILTILFLTTFEFLTGALEYSIREKVIYNQMLQRIYKELMIMGFITFVIAMTLAADKDNIFAEYITEIDFVGYITFFVALFFVAHAMYIMILSMHTSSVYENLHETTVADAVIRYNDVMKEKIQQFLFNLTYIPISSMRRLAEFKVIYSLFRDTYWLPPDFDYGAYLSQSFEKYSLKMINIGLSSWIVMILLSVANYVRIVLSGHIDALSCASYQHDHNSSIVVESSSIMFPDEGDGDRMLSTTVTHECSLMHLRIFLTCGGLIAFYVLSLFFIGRFYLKRLVARAGVTEMSDYIKFLMLEESIILKQATTRKVEISRNGNVSTGKRRRMSIGTFRSNVNTLLKENPHKDEENHIYEAISNNLSKHKHSSMIVKAFNGLRRSILPVSTAVSPIDESKPKIIYKPDESAGVRRTLKDMAAEASNDNLKPNQRKRGNLVIKLNSGANGQSDDAEDVESLTAIEQFKSIKLREAQSDNEKEQMGPPQPQLKRIMSTYFRDMQSKDKKKVNMKLSEDFSDIYFFRSPDMFFRAVEIAIMLNSLYLSLWACNFISLVNTAFNSSPFFHTIMLLPVLVLLPLLGEIVKAASLLAAIADLDLDVIGAVLESTEEKTQLLSEVRTKILTRIDGINEKDQMKILKQLYEEIDIDGNGTITKFEFRDMLRALSLHYSDYKFRKLFRAIDHNRSGCIDLDELINLVFPNLAEELEVKRRAQILKEQSESFEKSSAGQHRPRFMSAINRINSTASSSSLPLDGGEEITDAKEVGGDSGAPLKKSLSNVKISNLFSQVEDDEEEAEDDDEEEEEDLESGRKGADGVVSSLARAVSNVRMSALLSRREAKDDSDRDSDEGHPSGAVRDDVDFSKPVSEDKVVDQSECITSRFSEESSSERPRIKADSVLKKIFSGEDRSKAAISASSRVMPYSCPQGSRKSSSDSTSWGERDHKLSFTSIRSAGQRVSDANDSVIDLQPDNVNDCQFDQSNNHQPDISHDHQPDNSYENLPDQSNHHESDNSPDRQLDNSDDYQCDRIISSIHHCGSQDSDNESLVTSGLRLGSNNERNRQINYVLGDHSASSMSKSLSPEARAVLSFRKRPQSGRNEYSGDSEFTCFNERASSVLLGINKDLQDNSRATNYSKT